MPCSIVISIHNGEKYIIEKLDSIRDQIVSSDEVMIYDDCSSDDMESFISQDINHFKPSKWKKLRYYQINKRSGRAL